MKSLMLGILIVVTATVGFAQSDAPQNETPKQLVEWLCRMSADGMWLDSNHLDEFNRIAIYPQSRPSHSGGSPRGAATIAVGRNYIVSEAVVDGNRAQVKVEYFEWGDLFTTSFRFFRKEGLPVGEPVKRNADFSLVFSDRYMRVGPSGQEEVRGPLQWRVQGPAGVYVGVDAAVRYVTEMRGKLNDPILKYNADRTLVALKSILAGTPALLPRTIVPQESPSKVFQRFFKLESTGKGLTPDGQRELAEFFVETPKPQWHKILIIDVVDVGEALIDGDTAQIGVRANSLGELDSSLRLSGSPPCKPSPQNACYGDTGGFGYTFLLSEKPWDGKGKESIGPLAWRIYNFNAEEPEEPRITLDAAIRYVTEMRDKTTDAAVKKNADQTLAKLVKLH